VTKKHYAVTVNDETEVAAIKKEIKLTIVIKTERPVAS
jgi:hypothetical protein